ncbi:uncharacterized protein LOC107041948 [Diachasma alloeum]|uniref:uncharacterized protein LOC107041948 n=1 Tax=Diachasma alloeum TaxID=454923 RepID=UPI0007381818|nr:uncharacterized protein LOC107041948 [Diachasma alloeum]XP_015118263.1 uncharacterized protein LOC107041948 [Diachasma alloeum]XP_015118264.1 uncharacterized protein LOC107041948 [Diachasma alloeum]XP_015118265.1 uncharacterized protein LOC107041948 [Diachasma alloeum]
MEKIIPINWLNKLLLILSIVTAMVCLILEQWFSFTSLPIYIPLMWSLILITVSTWLSCIILKYTLKATAPLNIEPLTKWLKSRLQCTPTKPSHHHKIHDSTISKLISEIDEKYIATWYDSITPEKTFRNESKHLLKQLFRKISRKLSRVSEIRLTHKLTDVLLLHLKEYRRSLRRIEKGSSKDLEEAYRCSHPGSRSSVALEHTLHRMVTLIAREFLQWELASSLPCKLLLSVLAKRLLKMISEFSNPQILFTHIIKLLKSSESSKPSEKRNGVISKALVGGMASVTAPVIPRPFEEATPTFEITAPNGGVDPSSERSELSLEGLSSPKGLWAEEAEDPEDDGISPIYEEPTDFATTIARLRSLLQQKSSATTPQPEEKSHVFYEGNQFSNLAIPWTEFCTAPDGSQQLLYCIQFDDIEQHGEDLFETTTATTRRQYSDFVQLHTTLEEVPEYSGVISEIKLPDGGRVEMENYLRVLCGRLGESGQLRHFLRPSSGGGKKADAVAPRLDRFLAKTVTGVFNTLRTVVPGFEMEEEEVPLPTLMPLADIPWRFVEDIKPKNLSEELQQLVAERIDYCTVDTAYEAVDTVEGSGDSELLAHWWETANCPYDEELDEIDSKLMMTCSLLDILCEILAGIKSSSTIRQEAVVRWIKLFFGSCIEGVIQDWLRGVSEVLKLEIDEDEREEGDDNLEERVVDEVVGKACGDLKIVFGEGEFKTMVGFFIKSFTCKKVNCDVALQVLDVAASELLAVCREEAAKG